MRDSILFVVAVFVNLSLPITRCAVAEENKLTGEDALHLLDSLAAEQQKTLDRFKTYEAVFTVTKVRTGEFEAGSEEHRTRIKQGKDRLWLEDQSFVNSHAEGVTQRRWAVVANDQYAAWHISGQNPRAAIGDVHIWEHDSYAAMCETARTRIDILTLEIDFLKTGYGNGKTPLRDISGWAREHKMAIVISWKVSLGEAPAYEVKCYGGELSTRPLVEFTIDSARACIVTHCNTNLENGKPRGSLEVEPGEIEPGLWFPVHWKKTGFARDGSQNSRFITVVNLESMKTEVEPTAAECTLAALEIPDGTNYNPIIRTDKHGNMTFMHMIHGELVSRDVLIGRDKE